MMFIDKIVLDELSSEAKKSPRLRVGRDMRNSIADNSQRMLNAIEPGAEIPIHRHTKTTETVAVIRGKIRQKYYDDNGKLIREDIIEAGSSCPFYMVPLSMWHSTESLESGTIIFDCKDGAYEPLDPQDIYNDLKY